MHGGLKLLMHKIACCVTALAVSRFVADAAPTSGNARVLNAFMSMYIYDAIFHVALQYGNVNVFSLWINDLHVLFLRIVFISEI